MPCEQNIGEVVFSVFHAHMKEWPFAVNVSFNAQVVLNIDKRSYVARVLSTKQTTFTTPFPTLFRVMTKRNFPNFYLPQDGSGPCNTLCPQDSSTFEQTPAGHEVKQEEQIIDSAASIDENIHQSTEQDIWTELLTPSDDLLGGLDLFQDTGLDLG